MLENGICSLRCFLIFAAGIFALFNGPLWLIVSVRLFAGGPQAPGWLHQGVSWASRLAGLTVLAVWAWDATGALSPTLLLLVVLVIGLFCLLDGPVWLITQVSAFHRGRKSPVWLEHGVIWFVRLGGAGALLSGLVVGLRATIG